MKDFDRVIIAEFVLIQAVIERAVIALGYQVFHSAVELSQREDCAEVVLRFLVRRF